LKVLQQGELDFSPAEKRSILEIGFSRGASAKALIKGETFPGALKRSSPA
jgi:hypothetical protein